ELREVAEGRLPVRAVVAHGLVETDQAFLDQVVRVTAGKEVRGRLETDEAVVTADDPVVGGGVTLLRQGDQVAILDLNLTLRLCGDPRHSNVLPGRSRLWPGLNTGAVLCLAADPSQGAVLFNPELSSSSGPPFDVE